MKTIRTLEGFGRYLRKLRKNKDWTQKELAERANCEQRTISKLENGNGVHFRTALDVIQTLGGDLGVEGLTSRKKEKNGNSLPSIEKENLGVERKCRSVESEDETKQ